jgi:hypothetical protein
MSESTNASNTGCAEKVRLCLFIARRNGHTAVGDYVEVECKNESLQLVPNCKHVQLTYVFFIPYFDPVHSDIISPSLFSSRSMWKLLRRCGRWDWYPIYQDCRYSRYPDGTLTYLRGTQSGFRIQSTNSTTHSFSYCSVIWRIACFTVPCRVMSYAVL